MPTSQLDLQKYSYTTPSYFGNTLPTKTNTRDISPSYVSNKIPTHSSVTGTKSLTNKEKDKTDVKSPFTAAELESYKKRIEDGPT